MTRVAVTEMVARCLIHRWEKCGVLFRKKKWRVTLLSCDAGVMELLVGVGRSFGEL